MIIRESVSQLKRRFITVLAVAGALAAWFVLTLPVLPPLPEAKHTAPHQYEAQLDQSEGDDAEDPVVSGPVAPEREEYAAPEPAPSRRPLVPAYILPSPLAVMQSIVYLHQEEALVRSAFWSLWRITVSFLLAALVAIPLGILMGTYPRLKLWVEPLSGPMRFLPISAVTPLFVLWFGIGENMKIAFLFLGTVVFLLPVVVEAIENVDDVYLETAWTLGATPAQVITRVIMPAAWPGIFEGARVIYGIGWTYVILAELINAKYGLGYLITISAKRGHVDWIYALLIIILLLGIGTNKLFLIARERLFPWREAA
jgi:NitT/TauT family transport system permease protein